MQFTGDESASRAGRWKSGCTGNRLLGQNPRRRRRFRQRESWLLENRVPLAVTPVVTLGLPGSALIDEDFAFPLTFQNGGNPGDVGYGPYAELIVPPAGAESQQVEILGATYQAMQLPVTAVNFDQNGKASHPLLEDSSGQPLVVTATSVRASPPESRLRTCFRRR